MCARETGREGGRWESAALKGLRCGMRGAFRSREGRTPRPVVSSIFCPDRHGPRVLLGRLGVPTRGERGKPPAFRSPRGSRPAEASAWGRRGRGGSGASSASAARGGGCGEWSLGPLRSHPRPARQAARPGPATPAAAHVRRPPPAAQLGRSWGPERGSPHRPASAPRRPRGPEQSKSPRSRDGESGRRRLPSRAERALARPGRLRRRLPRSQGPGPRGVFTWGREAGLLPQLCLTRGAPHSEGPRARTERHILRVPGGSAARPELEGLKPISGAFALHRSWLCAV